MDDSVSTKALYAIALIVIGISVITLVGSHTFFTDDGDVHESQLAILSDNDASDTATGANGGAFGDSSVAKLIGVSVIAVSVIMFFVHSGYVRR